VVLAVLAAIWFIAFVNAFNFMDGINGISAAMVVATGAHLIVCSALWEGGDVGVVGWTLAAVVLGFLPFNFPTARVFLGDSGSYFLGAFLAGATVMGIRASVPPEVVIAPYLYYLADTGTTLLQRALRHESILVAHRQHAFQLLVSSGYSHVQVTSAVFGLVSISSATMVAVGDLDAAFRLSVLVVVVALNVGLPRVAVHQRRLQLGSTS
jgi:UDP-N-acetylmuramyl pentapeptide phosphotransferase/UDP-N-acetylglucosamine-1-phosphate transferase